MTRISNTLAALTATALSMLALPATPASASHTPVETVALHQLPAAVTVTSADVAAQAVAFARPGEGMIRITTRVCGNASTWQANAARNNVRPPVYLVLLGQQLSITCTAQAAPVPAPQAQASGWVHPLPGSSLSSCFGWRSWSNSYHQGLDMSAGSGTPIRAAAAGTVTRAGWIWSGYGISVTINHGGVSTHYAHQSRAAVHVGQWVSAGQTIGYVGSTGYSTGPHLHFEVAQSSGILGAQINPAMWLRNHGVSVGC